MPHVLTALTDIKPCAKIIVARRERLKVCSLKVE
jgi:hypothetical protein